ncbi:hypothetical protein [Micromonospora wenchangensis]|uniref:hypothetical protein n=1 Tax=Micromonospora wenchangensis TaxID=1185415 RepID=UPI003802C8EB
MDDPNGLTSQQYGNSLHYPDCLGSCSGCLPPLPDIQQPAPLDLTLFRWPALNSPIATRPQDWAPQARAILRERGAWRS